MNTRVRNQLIKIARTEGSAISYRRLINQTDLGLNLDIKHEKQLLGEILDEISEEEHENGRPLLSALVMDKRNGQGDRFYKLCEKLGLGEWKDLKKDEEFVNIKIQECCDFWRIEKNYEDFFNI